MVIRLLVVENGRLVRLVSLKDLLDFFSLKVELEEQTEAASVGRTCAVRPLRGGHAGSPAPTKIVH